MYDWLIGQNNNNYYYYLGLYFIFFILYESIVVFFERYQRGSTLSQLSHNILALHEAKSSKLHSVFDISVMKIFG